jgi:hypothetical protein
VIRGQGLDAAVDAPDHRGEEDVGRQDHAQLVVDGGEDVADREALVGHAVEDVGHRHGADCRAEPMAREVAQHHVQTARRLARGEQHVAVEDRHRRQQVLDLGRVEAAAVDDLGEHLLGDLVLLQQAALVTGELVALLAQRDSRRRW